MKRNIVTVKYYIQFLNEIGTPEADKKSNGGLIPDRAKYGQWLYKNDPIAFRVGLREHQTRD